MAARQRKTAEAKGDVVPPLPDQPVAEQAPLQQQPTAPQDTTAMDIDDQRTPAPAPDQAP